MRFIGQCIKSIAQGKWARWPLQKSYVEKLNAFQTRLVYCCLERRMYHHESVPQFCRRRKLEAKKIAKEYGLWSDAWARAIGKWHKHILSARNAHTWNKSIFQWRGDSWLQLQRMQSGRCRETKTRYGRHTVHKRWESCLSDAAAAAASSKA